MKRIALVVAGLSVGTGAIAAPMSATECAVWAREASFAKSVADRDAVAFRAHLHPDAVFFGPGQIRGGDAVAADWAGIVAAGELHWHPREVVVAGDTGIAYSRGPYWFPDTSPDAAAPYAVGQFLSTWVRGAEGEWQVLFDGAGSSPPRPYTEAQLAAMVAELPKTCNG